MHPVVLNYNSSEKIDVVVINSNGSVIGNARNSLELSGTRYHLPNDTRGDRFSVRFKILGACNDSVVRIDRVRFGISGELNYTVRIGSHLNVVNEVMLNYYYSSEMFNLYIVAPTEYAPRNLAF